MKTMMKSLVMVGVITTAFLGLIGCEKDPMSSENEQYVSILNVADDGTTSVIEANLKSVLIEAPELTDSELDILLGMKEEEKLAHDVYIALYEKWGSLIFSNISSAEERHMNAVIRLLEYYGSDETSVGEAGIFTIDKFQILYDELVAAGSVSIAEAYKTGLLIEEMDIKDLTEALEIVSNDNIVLVFENLLKASRNHLRAFNRELTKLEITYVPVYISQDEFDQILDSPMETGNRYRVNWSEGQNIQNRNGYHNGDGNGNCNGTGEGNSYGEASGEENSYGDGDGNNTETGTQTQTQNQTGTGTETQTQNQTQTQTGTGTGNSNGNGN